MNKVDHLLENASNLRQKANEIIPRLVIETPQIEYAYNPIDYAWDPHSEYIRRHGSGDADILLVGMNPGHGMGNTGIPFGCPKMVREILGISDLHVGEPPISHPKRLVIGLKHPKPEVSGTRIWGALSELFGPGDASGKEVFIVNHCPLWMFDEHGKNITPDKLRGTAALELMDICDKHLKEVVRILEITRVIGVGRYSQKRISGIFDSNLIPQVEGIPHPSPANPFANRNGGKDWRIAFEAALKIS